MEVGDIQVFHFNGFHRIVLRVWKESDTKIYAAYLNNNGQVQLLKYSLGPYTRFNTKIIL